MADISNNVDDAGLDSVLDSIVVDMQALNDWAATLIAKLNADTGVEDTDYADVADLTTTS